MRINTKEDVRRAVIQAKRLNGVPDVDLNNVVTYRKYSYDSILSIGTISSLLEGAELLGYEVSITPIAEPYQITESDGLVRIEAKVYPRNVIEFNQANLLNTLTLELTDEVNKLTPWLLRKIILRSLAKFRNINTPLRKNILSLCKFMIYGKYSDRFSYEH